MAYNGWLSKGIPLQRAHVHIWPKHAPGMDFYGSMSKLQKLNTVQHIANKYSSNHSEYNVINFSTPTSSILVEYKPTVLNCKLWGSIDNSIKFIARRYSIFVF